MIKRRSVAVRPMVVTKTPGGMGGVGVLGRIQGAAVLRLVPLLQLQISDI